MYFLHCDGCPQAGQLVPTKEPSTYVYTFVYVCGCIHKLINIYMYLCLCVCWCVYMCGYMLPCVCVRVHIQTPTLCTQT